MVDIMHLDRRLGHYMTSLKKYGETGRGEPFKEER